MNELLARAVSGKSVSLGLETVEETKAPETTSSGILITSLPAA